MWVSSQVFFLQITLESELLGPPSQKSEGDGFACSNQFASVDEMAHGTWGTWHVTLKNTFFVNTDVLEHRYAKNNRYLRIVLQYEIKQ